MFVCVCEVLQPTKGELGRIGEVNLGIKCTTALNLEP